MIKAIIIDDSPAARAALKADLEDYCEEVNLIGEAEGVVSGAKLIKEVQPELVFLDIQMNDGSGFDLLEILGENRPKIIFTTSSNEHAIQAFRFAAVDYLLKPIDPNQLKEAIEKSTVSSPIQISTLKSHLSGNVNRIALNSQEKIQIVEIPQVVRCESNGSYTLFFLETGEEILVTKTLKEYDHLLSGLGFLRVHQSHLINLSFIKEFIKKDGGYLILKDKTEIPVSSRKRSSVMAVLGDWQ
jgi:two-component system, LytTR family, response regulator